MCLVPLGSGVASELIKALSDRDFSFKRTIIIKFKSKWGNSAGTEDDNISAL